MPESALRDLMTDPAWAASDLGLPLPPAAACRLGGPAPWQDVIDYEEEHPRIAAALQAGYPRFFVHPLVAELFAEADPPVGGPGEGCLVFPSELSARAGGGVCVREKSGVPCRVEAYGCRDAACPGFPGKRPPAGARLLALLRGGGEQPAGGAGPCRAGTGRRGGLEEAGKAAKLIIRERLAALSGVDPGDVFLFPSGMKAVAAAHRLVTALRPGLPTVQLDFPYVDVLRVQQEFGSGVEFFPVADAGALAGSGSLGRCRSAWRRFSRKFRAIRC